MRIAQKFRILCHSASLYTNLPSPRISEEVGEHCVLRSLLARKCCEVASAQERSSRRTPPRDVKRRIRSRRRKHDCRKELASALTCSLSQRSLSASERMSLCWLWLCSRSKVGLEGLVPSGTVDSEAGSVGTLFESAGACSRSSDKEEFNLFGS